MQQYLSQSDMFDGIAKHTTALLLYWLCGIRHQRQAQRYREQLMEANSSVPGPVALVASCMHSAVCSTEADRLSSCRRQKLPKEELSTCRAGTSSFTAQSLLCKTSL